MNLISIILVLLKIRCEKGLHFTSQPNSFFTSSQSADYFPSSLHSNGYAAPAHCCGCLIECWATRISNFFFCGVFSDYVQKQMMLSLFEDQGPCYVSI